MVDKRAHIAWVLRQKALPPDVVRFIFERELRPYWRKLAASARRVLLRYITRARIVNYWIYEDLSGFDMRVVFRLINQMTQRWLDIGQASWTPRERRYVERRRYTQPHRVPMRLLWLHDNEQWGIGSR